MNRAATEVYAAAMGITALPPIGRLVVARHVLADGRRELALAILEGVVDELRRLQERDALAQYGVVKVHA